MRDAPCRHHCQRGRQRLFVPAHAGRLGALVNNFVKGGRALHRQGEGEKLRAFSVRCTRD